MNPMRTFALVIALILTALPAFAARVDLKNINGGAVIEIFPEGANYAVFTRLNDVWIVFDSPLAKLFPSALVGEPTLGILAQEKLIVPNGGGVRLSFRRLPNFKLVRIDNGFALTSSVLAQPLQPPQGIDANLTVLKDRINLTGKHAGTPLIARSAGTQETYGILTLPLPQPHEKQVQRGAFLFYPTFAGYALTSRNGQFVVPHLDAEKGALLALSDLDPLERGGINPTAIQDALGLPPQTATAQQQADAFAQDILQETRAASPTFGDTLQRIDRALRRIQNVPHQGQEYNAPWFRPGAELPFFPANGTSPVTAPDGTPLPVDANGQPLGPMSALPQPENLLPRYSTDIAAFFHEDRNALLRRIENVEDQNTINEARLELAKLYFAYGRYHEAGSLLGQFMQLPEGTPLADQVHILRGVSDVLIGRGQEALAHLSKPAPTFDNDRNLWLAMAYEQTGQHDKALPLFNQHIDEANTYPQDIKTQLRLSEARTLLALKKPLRVEQRIFDLAKTSPDGDPPAEAKYILAQSYLQRNMPAEAEQLLAEVAANTTDPRMAYLAQYAFVSFLLERDELGPQQAIQHLEDLRYLWRGDSLEQDILFKLGELYLSENNYRNGLERLKYFTMHFGDSPRGLDAANVMTERFTNLFLKEQKELPPLEVLSLYYDFRELTPPGREGDALIAAVSRKLRDVGLFSQAIELLEDQLQFRTTSDAGKAEMGLELSKLYALDLRHEDSLKVLQQTATSQQLPAALSRDLAIELARTQLALGNYTAATEAIHPYQDTETRAIRAELAWQREDYPAYVTLKEAMLNEKQATLDATHMLRLAHAYHALAQTRKLDELVSSNSELANSPDVKSALAFYQSDRGEKAAVTSSDNANWRDVVNSLDSFNTFERTYVALRERREEEKLERLDFNRRMGQVSAPPRSTGTDL